MSLVVAHALTFLSHLVAFYQGGDLWDQVNAQSPSPSSFPPFKYTLPLTIGVLTYIFEHQPAMVENHFVLEPLIALSGIACIAYGSYQQHQIKDKAFIKRLSFGFMALLLLVKALDTAGVAVPKDAFDERVEQNAQLRFMLGHGVSALIVHATFWKMKTAPVVTHKKSI